MSDPQKSAGSTTWCTFEVTGAVVARLCKRVFEVTGAVVARLCERVGDARHGGVCCDRTALGKWWYWLLLELGACGCCCRRDKVAEGGVGVAGVDNVSLPFESSCRCDLECVRC